MKINNQPGFILFLGLVWWNQIGAKLKRAGKQIKLAGRGVLSFLTVKLRDASPMNRTPNGQQPLHEFLQKHQATDRIPGAVVTQAEELLTQHYHRPHLEVCLHDPRYTMYVSHQKRNRRSPRQRLA